MIWILVPHTHTHTRNMKGTQRNGKRPLPSFLTPKIKRRGTAYTCLALPSPPPSSPPPLTAPLFPPPHTHKRQVQNTNNKHYDTVSFFVASVSEVSKRTQAANTAHQSVRKAKQTGEVFGLILPEQKVFFFPLNANKSHLTQVASRGPNLMSLEFLHSSTGLRYKVLRSLVPAREEERQCVRARARACDV